MDENIINKTHQTVLKLLLEQRIFEALGTLAGNIDAAADWGMRTQFDHLMSTYHYMIDYWGKGIEDAERFNLHRDLTAQALQLNDMARIVCLTSTSSDIYFQSLRRKGEKVSVASYQKGLENFSEDMMLADLISDESKRQEKKSALEKAHEDYLNGLFYELWMQGTWNVADVEEAASLLHSPLMGEDDLALAVSAVTMSLFQLFDPQKYLFLCDACEHEVSLVNRRALTGLFLVGYRFADRLSYYPKVEARLSILSDDERFASRLLTLQIQLLRSRETQNIDRKIREEIIPVMLQGQKLGIDIEKELQNDDFNPDWEDLLEKSGIKDKLAEMTELQLEGADVYLSTFSRLKSFPFFQELSHWFRPFSPNQPDVKQLFAQGKMRDSSFVKTIFDSAFLCNSDKYSFCLSMNQIPVQQREAFIGQIEQQGEAMRETSDELAKPTGEEQGEKQENQYIQDLYRFFKLHPNRKQFYDPFASSLNLLDVNFLPTVSGSSSLLSAVADFLLKKGYYNEAVKVFDLLLKKDSSDDKLSAAQLYQKKGYCLQKSGDYEKAVEAYHASDLLKAGSLWNIKHLAQCYRLLKQNDEALSYYLQAEEVEPENSKLLMQVGECLVELRRYDEAVTRFYKTEYLNPQSKQSWRALGWCLLATQKFDKAQTYYDKLLALKNIPMQDYLNAGHLAWAKGNLSLAIELYVRAISLNKNKKVFFDAFNNDKEMLVSLAIHPQDIPLMHDAILTALGTP